jgi:hypothetical protein
MRPEWARCFGFRAGLVSREPQISIEEQGPPIADASPYIPGFISVPWGMVSSTKVEDTIPHGSLMKPGAIFFKTWHIRNSGTVAWKDRQLERQGPITGPGLITSLRYVPVPDTEPGEAAMISVPLKAPTYDSSSIAYFKMVDANGNICFPDNHQLGLDVLVLVRGQVPDRESPIDDSALS